MTISIFALAAAVVAQAAAPQAPLNLTCGGGGTANKATARTAYSNAYVSGTVGTTPVSGSGYGTTTVYGTRQQGFEDQVDVRLFGGDDRIRLPRTSHDQAHAGSLVTPIIEALQPGDILLFSAQPGSGVTHVGMYVGEHTFIHSSNAGVGLSRLEAQDSDGAWWVERWVGARRVVQ